MSFKIRILFLAAFGLMLFRAEAQEADTTRILDESGWIEKMSNKIAVDLSFNNAFQTFEVQTSTSKTLLYPNTPTNLRFKVNFDFLSFGVQIAPDGLPGNGDNDERGESKAFEIGTMLVFKHWFAEVSYSRVSGYYLKNTDDFIEGWANGDAYVQFPDLAYRGVSLTGGYIRNSKFSMRSLTSQTERQLKSTGSFIPVLNADYYVVDDRSDALSTQKSNNMEVNMGPGYAYTWVLKERYYASLGVFGAAGYLHTKLTTRTPSGDIISNQNNFVLRGDCKVGIGYNGSRFYSGLFTSVTGTKYRQENTNARNTGTRVFYHLVVGMRFDAPEFLKKGVYKLKHAI